MPASVLGPQVSLDTIDATGKARQGGKNLPADWWSKLNEG